MKKVNMSSTWKTVQFFISPESFGIFEVEVDSETKDVRCNCNSYAVRTSCKHTRFVRRRMDSNQGHYTTKLSENSTAQTQAELAKEINKNIKNSSDNKSPSISRDFILKFGKVEVL